MFTVRWVSRNVVHNAHARKSYLRETLETIEMATRDGGQWGLRDVNDAAKMALTIPDEASVDTDGHQTAMHIARAVSAMFQITVTVYQGLTSIAVFENGEASKNGNGR
jgi:hypothetical protein